jgi:hypothetical protein
MPAHNKPFRLQVHHNGMSIAILSNGDSKSITETFKASYHQRTKKVSLSENELNLEIVYSLLISANTFLKHGITHCQGKNKLIRNRPLSRKTKFNPIWIIKID